MRACELRMSNLTITKWHAPFSSQAENDAEWSSHYRSLLDTKLEEAMKSPSFATSSGKTIRKHQARTKVDKLPRHEPTFMVSAIAQSKNEVRNVKDQLAKMEKRALIAEDRAKEATVMERKARAALDARDKQVASMRLRVSQHPPHLFVFAASVLHRHSLVTSADSSPR
jgi:inorganic triphosphatase YgiF